MRILGIDPGTATTGFGVIDYNQSEAKYVIAGVITTKPDTPMSERLKIIFNDIEELIEEFKPDEAAIELLFFGNNVTTAISVGQARGVAMLALSRANIEIYEYNPMEIKQAITGYGGAKKPQMQEMVRILLGLKTIPKPDDAADALAVALRHARGK